MANYNKKLVPEKAERLNRFRMETANDIGVDLKAEYGSDLTSKEAGSVGGKMIDKILQGYEDKIE
ncbi:hypothetical protein BJV85_002377 [Clostridium acetobutylicum]|uniref:Small acid-soluble spore protein n=1 Tax=Clostridium acetobutylicum (strain ATCC 824 / DSM 792 / JCM 1419 / IAM 19013 / LMG 5710 / NBRC 13948 / NRRL B-527 / VKM B-1787 / 2291 / W) TaxID=272562 RepID=Q97IM0_CLOAB|nr:MULTISPECIES: alpha/beta-type small acid-soluble spore protein [Clostridium]AAK79587.1 Small acid-soluble spore protein [Clostridium acetobutylicum ATCC 824]AEI31900.1 small acid-soluble spore protein [Clostridium acetobutylicum DSM 1731]AWV79974.1 small acid-soluble spore protein [Clostridium acetobutylicum]KHD34453.1 acid-soluble spore protein [Clostridium acetobutylicum]MBC2394039.1 alpha/beta-type small acid-soluble spore protein [Clostridium acetobutylicum]